MCIVYYQISRLSSKTLNGYKRDNPNTIPAFELFV